MKNKSGILITAFLLLLAGCTTRPSYVISDNKMEDVLYDLYLLEAAKNDNYTIFNSDSVRGKELTHSILRKHKVTEQQFDTSLLWYAAHLGRYEKILSQVVARYDIASEELKNEINAAAEERSANEAHNSLIDTAYFLLHTPGRLQNRYVFSLAADSLSKERSFNVSFEALGIAEAKPELRIHIFTPDTTFAYHEAIPHDGHYSKSFKVEEDTPPNRVYGYIELPDTVAAYILFRNFSLSADSLATLPSALKDKPLSLKNRQPKNKQ